MKKYLYSLIFFAMLISCATLSREREAGLFTARIFPTQGSETSGVIFFSLEGSMVHITGTVTGLSPGLHGFHIHQWGDLTLEDGTSTGGHYNPLDTLHGALESQVRHAGDLGNIEADAQGTADIAITVPAGELNGFFSILGRGVIIHAREDDYGQPTGNAGARVGYGVIGLGNEEFFSG